MSAIGSSGWSVGACGGGQRSSAGMVVVDGFRWPVCEGWLGLLRDEEVMRVMLRQPDGSSACVLHAHRGVRIGRLGDYRRLVHEKLDAPVNPSAAASPE